MQYSHLFLPPFFLFSVQDLFAHGRESDAALYFRLCIRVDVATQSRRDSSVRRSLSCFVHPEVPWKAAGQFAPLFTDAATV